MRDDLLDATAAVDWAETQIPILAERVHAWSTSNPYTIRIDTNSEPGKKLYRFSEIRQLDPIQNAAAGAIIHSIRSSFDLLACTLATRNGFPNSTDTYFPIWKSLDDFTSGQDKRVLKKIKRLSARDQSLIKALKPYPGGNDLLCALHDLDLTRKHRRLLTVEPFGRGIMFIGFPTSPDIRTSGTWRGFNEETILARTDASVPDGDVSVAIHVALGEAGSMKGRHVPSMLRDFAGYAKQVIKIFDR